MKTFDEKKEKQIKDSLLIVNKWEGKLKFSKINLLFFIFVLFSYNINPLYGVVPNYVFLLLIIFFLQQTIRSYNYLKFYRVSHNQLLSLHEMAKNIIKKG
jgi:hypothetical protein